MVGTDKKDGEDKGRCRINAEEKTIVSIENTAANVEVVDGPSVVGGKGCRWSQLMDELLANLPGTKVIHTAMDKRFLYFMIEGDYAIEVTRAYLLKQHTRGLMLDVQSSRTLKKVVETYNKVFAPKIG